MELQKNAQLIKNLFIKRELLLKGDGAHTKFRTGLIILGGGMRGAGGGGSLMALHKLKLENVFDVVVGISAGASLGAAFLAGSDQIALSTSMYYTDLPPRLVRYSKRPIVDIDFIESLLRHQLRGLNTPLVRESRSDFHIAVTESSSGQGLLLNSKDYPDMITLIKASIALPGLYGRSVSINGQSYVDGGVGHPFPAEEVVERFGITDLLIIANRPFHAMQNDSRSALEKAMTRLLLRNSSARVRDSVIARKEMRQNAVAYLQSHEQINWGVIFSPDTGIHMLTRNKCKLRKLAKSSGEKTLATFGKPGLHIDLL